MISKEPKPRHPKELEGNGHFSSDGGLDIYKLLWGLQGRVGRLEGGFAIVIIMMGAMLGRVFGAW